jgi:hypothetical protein
MKSAASRRGTSTYPGGPEMEENTLVATAVRPQDHFDEKL